ncbi:hybrid sensor histidine kinase/response regulator transcription factor [Fibrella aquatica]|uniref:hybrid sensor histidine kinase/response regulator transcription factor n=1 Tax=Fibrella aquatica TaxID=3242487 RepID=UPI003521A2DB
MKLSTILWLSALYFALLPRAKGQTGIEHFSHLSVEEGLSQSSVYAIAQDPKGFMWFGTRNGLNRYDSRHVIVYQPRSGVPNSLASNIINSLLLDKQGRLWVGTSKGIGIYRHQQDDFLPVSPLVITTGKPAESTINTLLEDHQHRVWLGTSRGLFRLHKSDLNRCDRLIDLTDQQGDLSNQTIRTLYEDRERNVWVGTSGGLARLKPTRSGQFELTNYYLHSADSVYHNTSNGVNAIAEDKAGRLWIGTERNGIALFDKQKGRVVSWNPAPRLDVSTQTVRTIMPDGKGNFWVGTMTGLHIIAQDGSRARTLMNQPTDPSSLSDNSVRSLFRDRDGSFWVGTYYGGVAMYSPLARQFGSYRPVDSRGGMPFKIAGPMLEATTPNQRWVGTEDRGLFLVNADKSIARHYVHDPKVSQSLTNDKVKCLLADGTAGLWVGTLKGLNYIDLRRQTVTRYLHEPNNPKSLPDDHIYDLKRDAQGTLWVATYFGGLCRFDEQMKSFSSIRHEPNRNTSLSSNAAIELLVDSQQQLWVGTVWGLNRKITGQDAFVRYLHKPGDSTSLSSDHVVCLLEDRKHQLWVGTRENGLNLLLPNQRSFRRFTTSNGLPSNTVFGIQEDQRGRLWVSTDKGLAQFDSDQSTFIAYDKEDGLVCKEFTPNSTFQDARGQLYFGGYSGIVMFHPDSIRRNTTAPKLAFTQLRLFNQPLPAQSEEVVDRLNVDSEEGLTFTYQQNVFSLSFSAFNYINSPKNRYAYQLAGFDRGWNYVSEPQAMYMNLPAGTYTLRVKGTNNDDVWNRKPLELKITVLPPPWKTPWAYVLYVLTFLGLLRLWSGINRNRLQLAHDLKVEHDEKNRQQELHQIKLNFFTEIAHEIRTPLTLVMAPIEVLANQYANDGVVQKQLAIMRNSTDRLLRLLNQLLDFRKHETGNIQLQQQEVDMVLFLRTITDSFAEHARSQHITLIYESEVDTLIARIDVGELEKVVYNLLVNAFKFTPADGTVSIRLQQEFTASPMGDRVVIVIEDTGQGISAGDIDHIFDQFYQVNQPRTRDSGFGLGLALSKHIVEQHGGQINVESCKATAHQSGFTRFTISLPVGNTIGNQAPVSTPAEPEPALTTVALPPVLLSENGLLPKEGSVRPIVLLVEDQDDIRTYIRHLFENTYQVIEAADGAAGWEKAARLLPDIIIADVAMPIMDGFALTHRLKSDPRTSHIPVIILTAKDTVDNQLTGLETGADDYLTKPFHPILLQARVNNLLNLREQLKARYNRQVTLQPQAQELDHPDAKFLNQLMMVLDKHLHEPEFNVGSLVSEIGMSRPVLFRKVKMLTGLSVIDLLRTTRLKKAEQLLKQRKASVSEVAFAVGFSDPKYFSRAFRSQYGMTPTEFSTQPVEEVICEG